MSSPASDRRPLILIDQALYRSVAAPVVKTTVLPAVRAHEPVCVSEDPLGGLTSRVTAGTHVRERASFGALRRPPGLSAHHGRIGLMSPTGFHLHQTGVRRCHKDSLPRLQSQSPSL